MYTRATLRRGASLRVHPGYSAQRCTLLYTRLLCAEVHPAVHTGMHLCAESLRLPGQAAPLRRVSQATRVKRMHLCAESLRLCVGGIPCYIPSLHTTVPASLPIHPVQHSLLDTPCADLCLLTSLVNGASTFISAVSP